MAGSTVSLRLRQAIVMNDLPLVQRLLQSHPSYLHNPDFENKSNTSLHLAAQYGLADIVKYLIELGHDSTAPVEDDIYSNAGNNQGVSVNTDGQTPLHLAATKLHTEIVEILCASFPTTVNRADNEGCTPLQVAAKAQSTPITPSTAQFPKPTVKAELDSLTIEYLLAYGADVRTRDNKGNTCLHHACAWGNLKAVLALMEAGVDPLQTNHAGWRPEAYSLTVQAEVYFRNLAANSEKKKAEEIKQFEARRAQGAGGGGGGGVRLVSAEDDSDDIQSDSTGSYAGRSRSDSTRSAATTESGGL
jgi:ankyrin repeat protein